jgi:hypothetical protein
MSWGKETTTILFPAQFVALGEDSFNWRHGFQERSDVTEHISPSAEKKANPNGRFIAITFESKDYNKAGKGGRKQLL